QANGGPLIAVIDTGVNYNHEAIKGNIWTNPGEIPGDGIDNDGNGVIDDVHGFNAAAKTGDPLDDNDHGSHCAGSIAADGNNSKGLYGVSKNANIMGVKFLTATGGGTLASAIDSVLLPFEALFLFAVQLQSIAKSQLKFALQFALD